MVDGVRVALQTRIYSLLSSDFTLTSTYGCSVYDNIPDNALYPTIQIGEDQADDWGAIDVNGYSIVFTIHTWTQAEGNKLCKQIQDRLYSLLHKADLAIAGHSTVSLRAGMSTTMLDPDGRTQHGVSKFNLILGG